MKMSRENRHVEREEQGIVNTFQPAGITHDTCTKSPITTLFILLQLILDKRKRRRCNSGACLSYGEENSYVQDKILFDTNLLRSDAALE